MDESRKSIHRGIEEMIGLAMEEYQCDYKEGRILSLVALVGEMIANIASLTVKVEALEKKLNSEQNILSKVTLN